MRAAVADSSLVLKWVVEEHDSDAALALRRHYHFLAPDLLYAECTNAFWKFVRKGQFSIETIAVAMRAIQADPLEIHLVQPLMPTALRIAIDHDHPAYDCIFVALAIREGCPMITADASLARKMRAGPAVVLTIEEALKEASTRRS